MVLYDSSTKWYVHAAHAVQTTMIMAAKERERNEPYVYKQWWAAFGDWCSPNEKLGRGTWWFLWREGHTKEYDHRGVMCIYPRESSIGWWWSRQRRRRVGVTSHLVDMRHGIPSSDDTQFYAEIWASFYHVVIIMNACHLFMLMLKLIVYESWNQRTKLT